MIVTTRELVRRVRTALNHNPTRNGPLGTNDIETLTLDKRIAHYLPEAIMAVETAADATLFDSSPSFIPAGGGELFVGSSGEIWMPLPHDFMRLVELRMSGWSRSLYALTDPESTKARLAMIAGGGELIADSDSPMAVRGRWNGTDSLQLFGTREDETVTQALYRRLPAADAEAYEVAPALIPAIAAEIARRL